MPHCMHLYDTCFEILKEAEGFPNDIDIHVLPYSKSVNDQIIKPTFVKYSMSSKKSITFRK